MLRRLVFFAAAILISGAAAAEMPRHPFGAADAPFSSGALRPDVAPEALDQATAAFYDAWKSRYLIMGCDGADYRVKADAGDAVTVSEGQGYGLVIVALMAGHDPEAQAIFDGLFRYARHHPSAFDDKLMAWAQDAGCKDIQGQDSATDGDLDIAYGLLLADAQWGSGGAVDYRREAQLTLSAIVAHTVDPETGLMRLGDWVKPEDPVYANSTRSSDWMIGHFRAFARLDPSHWQRSLDAALLLVERMQVGFAPRTGLLPDFVVDTDNGPKPAAPQFLEADTDGDFSWNACRTPWRLGVDALLSGDARSVAAVRNMTKGIRRIVADDPRRIASGYRLDGSAIDTAPTMAFIAPFAVAAMSAPDAQDWLDALWSNIVATAPQGYYEDSIKLQVMLAVSGNWWRPG